MLKQYEPATVVALGAAATLVHGGDGILDENAESGGKFSLGAFEYVSATSVDLGAADALVLGPSGWDPDNPDHDGEQVMNRD